jgi:hypothetical protein
MIKLDGTNKVIPYQVAGGAPHPVYTDIVYSIDNSGFGLTCTLTISDYKLNFSIVSNTTFNKIGFYLDGTSLTLANYMGLTEDTEVIYTTPSDTVTIQMPSQYKTFDQTDIYRFTTYISSYGFNNLDDIASYSAYEVRALPDQNRYIGFTLMTGGSPYGGTITVDTEQHYIGYILGFNSGDYLHNQRAPNQVITPIKLPKYYDNRLLISIDRNVDERWYSIYVPDGYYTSSDLATYLTGQFALISELSASTVIVSDVGVISINIVTTNPHSSIAIRQFRYYGWIFLINRIGFEDQFIKIGEGDYLLEITGTNITTATFTASKPFIYKPINLYIRSAIFGQLIEDNRLPIDDPTYQLDKIIHKIQINAAPGGTITDNKKYQTKKYVTNPLRSPITSIDFSLYNDDGQLVQLNGRSWSIGIKIEF